MTFGNYTYLNYNRNNTPNAQFRGKVSDSQILSKPVEQVGNVIHKTVDKFVPQNKTEDENAPTEETQKKRKSKKSAITALSSVIVVSGLVAIFNPSFSNKLLTHINKTASKAGTKAKTNATLKDKIYNLYSKGLTEISKDMQFVNTINASKDVFFTWLCKSEKFAGVKNETLRNVLQSINKWFTKIMSKAHNGITKMFDYVSRKTVYTKYAQTNKSFDSLDRILSTYRSKLSASDRLKFDKKYKEIMESRDYFKKPATKRRLFAQQESMKDLQKDFIKKLDDFSESFEGGIKSPKKFFKNWHHNSEHIRNSRSFWAQDIMAPQREIVNKEGKAAVDKLIGNGKDQAGSYEELIDIISPYIKQEEQTVLKETVQSIGKKLRKANKTECMEYFDKKRDLMLGGAPTDIVTAATTLGVSGVLIGTADNKEDRISRLLTMVIPAISGVGVSFAMASALFSGTTSLLSAGVSSVLLSKIGSKADDYLVQSKKEQKEGVQNA